MNAVSLAASLLAGSTGFSQFRRPLMEPIRTYLNGKNQLNGQSTQNEWQTPSHEETKLPSAAYLGHMIKIIAKAISLANAPMLTESELLVRARDWSETLWGIVPADALTPAFRRAFETHNSTFPLSAYDLKLAYAELNAHRLTIEGGRLLTVNERVQRCPNKSKHLDSCGDISIYIPDLSTEGIVPCGRCQPEAFSQAKSELLMRANKGSLD